MYFPEFGENLKRLCLSRNLTQKDFGAAVGLSKAVVSKYENSLGYPSLNVLVKIASFYGVTTDYLLGVPYGKTVDVSALSESQVEVVQHLISEFIKANEK